MRIALAQLNYVIGDFETNVHKTKHSIVEAKKNGADLVVFPELNICAYPPRDFLEFDDFIKRCQKAAEELASECLGIAAIIGMPTVNPKIEGKNLFNSAVLLNNGRIESEVHKSLLPNYDIFDEYRYFEPGKEFNCIEVAGVKIALSICEDLWNIEDDPMYVSCPMDSLILQHPQLMINIAASPFSYDHAEQRQQILLRNVNKYKLPLLYVNHVGAQTELIFDGGSCAFNTRGERIYEMRYFLEDISYFEFDPATGELVASSKKASQNLSTEKSARIYHALVLGIKDYFEKLGFKKAILGLSGGIDSALVTVLAAQALGPENVHVLMMPSEFSSEGSVNDSLQLIKNTGVTYDQIPISTVFKEYRELLGPFFKDESFGLTEENLQARIRGMLLMAFSNKFGRILLNTSNKSEMAVGYGTLYGDMCGGLSVIGDLYKTEVYELSNYINRNTEIIPKAILDKAPSAELRPGQKDSDSLPEYNLLDPVLYNYIEERKGPRELINMGFDEQLVRRTLKLVNTNEYKRHQTPPVLRVSRKAFGQGRRMPIVGKYLS